MPAENVTRKIVQAHLAEGEMAPGAPIGLRIDQTLTQDATGTMVMLALEAMQLDRVRTEVSVQYVDHNLIQADHRNPDDHAFLRSACRRFGVWYSRPGNGVSHPVHMQRFGRPGRTLAGSDSHTPAAGAIGMLALGAGGIDVAMAMVGEPLRLRMPEVWGVELTGELPDWVSAKDVILEMLRRHDVDGATGCVLEYYGPGLASLSAMDRHVIANMGTELGATSTVFPADGEVRRYLESQGRGGEFEEWLPDDGCTYDRHEQVDLSALEPMIAKPSSPGNVVPVREVAGEEIYQAYIGSSANPGYRDFAVCAEMLAGRTVAPGVSYDVNPTSRQLLETLIHDGRLAHLVHAGARLHQAGCNGCIGMGQAPATGRNSLRTVPRNFPGRSGTVEDAVFLCSPETATASAIAGRIADPRDMEMAYPRIDEPAVEEHNLSLLEPPLTPERAATVELVKGPNIAAMPSADALPHRLELEVALVVGDDVSTDEIMPAGSDVLPYRSNIPKISRFVFRAVDPAYVERADRLKDSGGHVIVGGDNYGQGSSREHAALAPRHLGLRMVVARSFARIHWQNLVNYGILPLTIDDTAALAEVATGDVLALDDVTAALRAGPEVELQWRRGGGKRDSIAARHALSDEQIEILAEGGLINWKRQRIGTAA